MKLLECEYWRPDQTPHSVASDLGLHYLLNTLLGDKTYKMACAPSDDSAQPVYPPNLIRVFARRSVGS